MTSNVDIRRAAWQSIPLIIVCGCLIAMLGFGPRSTLGFFLTPMSNANGWCRDVFALAIALQMLLWGAAQPFIGAIADRFGPVLVLCIGAVLYAIGFSWMVFATTPTAMYLSAGVLIGFGLAGASFTVVIGAFGKLLPVVGFGLCVPQHHDHVSGCTHRSSLNFTTLPTRAVGPSSSPLG
jgi:MFS family permease